MLSKRRLLFIVILGGLLLYFWDREILLPFKLFVVLVHEICHALAALAFGGSVESIVLHLDESGMTTARTEMGGGFIVMVSAGYIGSTIIGALLLNRGLVGRGGRTSLFILGAVLLFMSIRFTWPAQSGWDLAEPAVLTTVFGISWGLFLITAAGLSEKLSRLVLIAVGSLSALYSIFDLGDFIRGVETTDAGILAAHLLKRPPGAEDSNVILLAYMIAFIWSLISLSILYGMVHHAVRLRRERRSPQQDGYSAPAGAGYEQFDSNYSEQYYPEPEQAYYPEYADEAYYPQGGYQNEEGYVQSSPGGYDDQGAFDGRGEAPGYGPYEYRSEDGRY